MTERKKGTVFSIFIHPRKLADWDVYHPYFLKQFRKFYVSFEKGTHYQCCVVAKSDMMSHNIKSSLNRLTDLDDDEKKHAICVKLHADEKYLLGYCQKEGKEVANEGYTSEELQEGREVKSTGVGKFNVFDNMASKLTMNEVAEVFIETYLSDYTPNKLPISDYVTSMLTNISPFISYQTYQKIKLESFREYLDHRTLYHRQYLAKIPNMIKTKNKKIKIILSNYTDYQKDAVLEENPCRSYEEEDYFSSEDDEPLPRFKAPSSKNCLSSETYETSSVSSERSEE